MMNENDGKIVMNEEATTQDNADDGYKPDGEVSDDSVDNVEVKKKCSKCGVEKSLGEFYVRKSGRIESVCKICSKQSSLKYYNDNKETRSIKNKEYRRKNGEKIKDHNKIYYQENKKEIDAKNKKWNEENEQRHKEYQKQYKKDNKEKINSQNNERSRKKTKEDPNYKLRKNISRNINRILKTNGGAKLGQSVLKFLPYETNDLRNYMSSLFEPWMTWENHGPYDKNRRTWQIDHIIPASLLPHDSMEHPNFLKCWCLENLRPLETIKNIKKGNKILPEFEEKYEEIIKNK